MLEADDLQGFKGNTIKTVIHQITTQHLMHPFNLKVIGNSKNRIVKMWN